ncbi:MAG: AAA family ATPase [Chthoniobacterales bacterium]
MPSTQEEIAPQTSDPVPPESLAAPDASAVEFFQGAYTELKRQLGKVIVGQNDVIDEILIAIFTRNHALLMGVPGLAKTLLISTLSKTLTLSFKRIQFTPDLMPSDITGTEIIYTDPVTGGKEFKFLQGPVFSNIVLADEINRTPPKTQAAMLEAMQERRVTVGGNTHKLPEPFFVLATQNPLEQEGTYPLPEAQLDRFLFLINVGYPSEAEELEIMRRGTSGKVEEPKAIMGAEHIQYLQNAVRQMPVADHVYQYAERIVRCTRPKEEGALDYCKKFLSFGAGPRASLGLIMAAKGHALLQGQVYTGCENVAAIAKSVMRHRMAVNFTAQSEGITSDTVVTEILKAIPAR